jgi:hypothetical protein
VNPRTPGINDAIVQAEKAQRDAIAAAQRRVQDRVRVLSQEEARKALRAIDDELAALDKTLQKYGAMDFDVAGEAELDAAMELSRRRDSLALVRVDVAKKLPIGERIGEFRPLSDFGGRQAVFDEAMDVGTALEAELGYATRWTGRVTLGESEPLNAAGLFGWDGHLDLAKAYAAGIRGEAARFKVVLHEMWHSMSRLTDPTGYSGMIGFEEGLVERLTQLSWERVRTRAGRPPAAYPYRSYEAFTRPLEKIEDLLTDRGAFPGGKKDIEAWYVELLSYTTGADRRQAIRDLADRYFDPKWGAANARLDDALRALDRALSVAKA